MKKEILLFFLLFAQINKKKNPIEIHLGIDLDTLEN